LAPSDDAKPTPRKTTPQPLNIPETPEEAASMLQRMFRTRMAWRLTIERAKKSFEKLFDEDTGTYYYW
jgi:hypothetical protein